MPPTVELDPSEVRSRPLEPPRRGRAPVKRMPLALGVLCLAGVSAGVFFFVSAPDEPQQSSEVRFAKVDWPEIKDGVPEAVPSKLLARSTAASIVVPPARAGDLVVPSETVPGSPERITSSLPSKPEPLRQAGPALPEAPTAEPPPVTQPDPTLTQGPAPSEAPVVTQAPVPVEAPPQVAPDAPAPIAASLPAAAPVAVEAPSAAPVLATPPVPLAAEKPAADAPAPAAPAAKRKPEPKQKPLAKSERQRAAATRPGAPGRAQPPAVAEGPPLELAPPPAPEEERASVFGLELPAFVPTGRQIKQKMQAIGDAVTSLPDKL